MLVGNRSVRFGGKIMSRRWVRRAVLVVIGTLAISAAGIGFSWWSTRADGQKRLDAWTAKLDAENPAWRMSDLVAARNARLPPPDRNSGYIALDALGLMPQEFKDWYVENKWLTYWPHNHLPEEEELCRCISVHEQSADAIAAACRLRHQPVGGFAINAAEPNPLDTPLPHLQKLRALAHLLQFQVVIQAASHRPDEAVDAVHALLNNARAVGDEPSLMSHMVRQTILTLAIDNAERALGHGEPKTGLVELQAALLEEAAYPRMAIGLRGELAMLDRLFENLDSGKLSFSQLDGKPAGTGWDAVWADTHMAFTRQYIPANRARMIECIDAYLQADKLTGRARLDALDAISVPTSDGEAFLVSRYVSGIVSVVASDDRVKARLACAAAAIACERFRQKHGRWPANLAEIPKEILANVPMDPFTGNPLLYLRRDDGITIYSVGNDRKDNGGLTLDPREEFGTDIGFRLWNPDQRGLPPIPTNADESPD